MRYLKKLGSNIIQLAKTSPPGSGAGGFFPPMLIMKELIETRTERKGGNKMKTTISAPAQQKSNTGNAPEKKFRSGGICATVWKNQSVKDGKVVEFRTVSFDRNYQDKEGEWNTTNSLRVNDLPRASLVLQKAYEYVALRETASDEAHS
ncbi:MAG: hypothetical protein ABIJ34_00915 [archaeon]